MSFGRTGCNAGCSCPEGTRRVPGAQGNKEISPSPQEWESQRRGRGTQKIAAERLPDRSFSGEDVSREYRLALERVSDAVLECAARDYSLQADTELDKRLCYFGTNACQNCLGTQQLNRLGGLDQSVSNLCIDN